MGGGNKLFADRNHNEESGLSFSSEGNYCYFSEPLPNFSIRFSLVNIVRHVSQAHLFLIKQETDGLCQFLACKTGCLKLSSIDNSYQKLLFTMIKADHTICNLVAHYYLILTWLLNFIQCFFGNLPPPFF